MTACAKAGSGSGTHSALPCLLHGTKLSASDPVSRLPSATNMAFGSTQDTPCITPPRCGDPNATFVTCHSNPLASDGTLAAFIIASAAR